MTSSKDKTPAQGMRKGLTKYGDDEFALFLRKSFIKGAGYGDEALGRPVVGIINTGSDFNPCHGNADELIERVKAGIEASGALPMAFPTISLHEAFSYPTSMYLRNLMSMDTEEMLRALPLDSVVLVGGCDKTVPAQLMGAISADVPFVQLVTGPMSTGSFRGQRVGACTDCRRLWADYRAGNLDEGAIAEANNALVPTIGTCGVMGTASTMALLAGAMGLMPLDGATAPAVSADRRRVAEKTGVLAADIAKKGVKPSAFLSQAAFDNALRVLLAVGGSTNAIIHLAAIAGRSGHDVSLERLDNMARQTPVLVDLKPSGSGYMEDLHDAGGLVRILDALGPLIDKDAVTVSGKTLGTELASFNTDWPQNIVRTPQDPLFGEGGLAVLYGNLAPDGAIIKVAAASPDLLVHTGKAVVFEDMEDLAARIDSPDLEVTPEDVLVLRNIGPKGAPGMPEAGLIPIPRKLARQGVKDMVRISDGRMSGTAAGTIVLHAAPEAAIGGALAYVKTGDIISLNVEKRALEVDLSEAELEARAKVMPFKTSDAKRGYAHLFHTSVLQAPDGVDFDFLRAEGSTNKV
ncbi:MAG: dihydroxy-acid dehydratase [Alphaproteobacteria bacterium]|nr:dihydroxy-acid dehydratase [Alphaproteobacteria bacterium]MBL6777127.1 dihydroxy-acid dehydratase [Alphaproteobacteria bacterium]